MNVMFNVKSIQNLRNTIFSLILKSSHINKIAHALAQHDRVNLQKTNKTLETLLFFARWNRLWKWHNSIRIENVTKWWQSTATVTKILSKTAKSDHCNCHKHAFECKKWSLQLSLTVSMKQMQKVITATVTNCLNETNAKSDHCNCHRHAFEDWLHERRQGTVADCAQRI